MHQVLFTIPILKETLPPDGISLSAFGAMLVLAFIAAVAWGIKRTAPLGLPAARMQDMALWLIISGLIGARLLYMIQYSNQFQDRSVPGMLLAFVSIWRGGIIFYGSAFGGAVGYGLFYWFVIRKLKINGWQLADAVAPLLALGLAIGRVGCLLNGCCWGQVACEGTCPVPLGALHFPLLPAHARDLLVSETGLQTSTGFAVTSRGRGLGNEDSRSIVSALEPGSAAAAAGLKVGDRIASFNGRANAIVLELSGPPEKVEQAQSLLLAKGAKTGPGDTELKRLAWAAFEKPEEFRAARVDLAEKGLGSVVAGTTDRFDEAVRWDWPRGQNELELTVTRDGKEISLPTFTPRSVGLYPTQVYETVSMILLIFVLLAFYPYRRHDGQLFTLMMLGYALHRFINESLRIEPTVGLGLTLSQWGSVVIFTLAVGLEAYLWITTPSRWKNPQAAAPVQTQAT